MSDKAITTLGRRLLRVEKRRPRNDIKFPQISFHLRAVLQTQSRGLAAEFS